MTEHFSSILSQRKPPPPPPPSLRLQRSPAAPARPIHRIRRPTHAADSAMRIPPRALLLLLGLGAAGAFQTRIARPHAAVGSSTRLEAFHLKEGETHNMFEGPRPLVKERDACGVGFIANTKTGGERGRGLVDCRGGCGHASAIRATQRVLLRRDEPQSSVPTRSCSRASRRWTAWSTGGPAAATASPATAPAS